MSDDSPYSDNQSSIQPLSAIPIGERTRSRVMIPDAKEPENILVKPLVPPSTHPPVPDFIDLGDDWPSDEEEVSKPILEPSVEPNFNLEITVERELYKHVIIPFCEKLDSIMTLPKLDIFFKDCPCTIVIPDPGERAHRFNKRTPELGIPKAVISTAFLKVGFFMPIHPFLREVLEFYELAPMQLTPNSYHLAISTYIMYASKFSTPLSAPKLGFFFRLKETGRGSGCFYLSAWPCHQGQCIKGVKQNFEQWQEQFVYCFDCPSVKFEFNRCPRIPKQTVMSGVCLERANEILKLSSSIRDCMILTVPENLIPLGFLPADSGITTLLSYFISSFIPIPIVAYYISF